MTDLFQTWSEGCHRYALLITCLWRQQNLYVPFPRPRCVTDTRRTGAKNFVPSHGALMLTKYCCYSSTGTFYMSHATFNMHVKAREFRNYTYADYAYAFGDECYEIHAQQPLSRENSVFKWKYSDCGGIVTQLWVPALAFTSLITHKKITHKHIAASITYLRLH